MNRKVGNNNYLTSKELKEKFVDISGSVRGPMVNSSLGLRLDMPVRHPIKGPVSQPSPLNSEYIYNFPICIVGVL